MEVRENPGFTADYYAADKRFIGNAIQVFFRDGTHTARVQVDTPIGHRRRRFEGYPVLVEKFRDSLPPVFPEKQAKRIETLFADTARLDAMPVDDFVAHLVRN
jgi:2-methylcitrate dehydratase